VIEVAEELVEAMLGRQVLVLDHQVLTKMDADSVADARANGV